MRNKKLLRPIDLAIALASAVFLLSGCQTSQDEGGTTASASATGPAVTKAPEAAKAPEAPKAPQAQKAPEAAKVPEAPRPTIRIKTGVSSPVTDSSGNVWLADQGFVDSDTVERSDLPIENTKDPVIYRAERYSM